MSHFRSIFSKKLLKLALGGSVLGGLGYATYQFNEYILNQPSGNHAVIKFNKVQDFRMRRHIPLLSQ